MNQKRPEKAIQKEKKEDTVTFNKKMNILLKKKSDDCFNKDILDCGNCKLLETQIDTLNSIILRKQENFNSIKETYEAKIKLLKEQFEEKENFYTKTIADNKNAIQVLALTIESNLQENKGMKHFFLFFKYLYRYFYLKGTPIAPKFLRCFYVYET